MCDGIEVRHVGVVPSSRSTDCFALFRTVPIEATSPHRYAVGLDDEASTELRLLLVGFPRVCARDQYACKSSKLCIPKSNLCDTISQCHDRSDEMFCRCPIEDYLSQKLFHRCGSTEKCLPKDVECDIKRECRSTSSYGDDDDDDDDQCKRVGHARSTLDMTDGLFRRSCRVVGDQSILFDECELPGRESVLSRLLRSALRVSIRLPNE